MMIDSNFVTARVVKAFRKLFAFEKPLLLQFHAFVAV